MEKLKDLDYKKLYYSIKSTHEYVDSVIGEPDSRAVLGFTTSTKTRPLIVAKLEEFIRNKLIKTYSSRSYHEFKTFIWNNGKAQAMRGYNDDLVMACAIGCWIRDMALTVNKQEVEYKRAMLNCLFKTKRSIKTTVKGMNSHNKNKYVKPDPKNVVMNLDKPFFIR